MNKNPARHHQFKKTMKYLLFITVSLLIGLQDAKATITIPLDSILKALDNFLIEHEPWSSEICKFSDPEVMKDGRNVLVRDRRFVNAWDGYIQEGKEGVYMFSGCTVNYSTTNYVLVDKDSFQILNTRDPLEDNILKLLSFFQKNIQYSKEDISFYMKDFIKQHQRNSTVPVLQ